MTTMDITSSLRSGTDTSYVDVRVEYVIDHLLRSKDMVEIYHAAAEGIDPKQVHSKYTQRLLVLQEKLNKTNPGLGSRTARGINERIESMDYFTALGIIDYILQNSKNLSAEDIPEIPRIIEGIKGKNGADSRFLRYHFVNKWLHRTPPGMNVARLAKKFVGRYGNSEQKTSEDIQHTRQKCVEWYGGDFEKMKKMITDKVRKDLEGVVRSLAQIEKAEPDADSSNS